MRSAGWPATRRCARPWVTRRSTAAVRPSPARSAAGRPRRRRASDAQAAIASTKARETRDMSAARDRVLANLQEPANDKVLRAFADDLAVRCDKAANDPVATVLMKPPLGRVSTVSRRYVDGLLAPYGRAGWQSNYILTTGALAEAVGTCEARLPDP
ncbi:hypothetical protein ACRAWD_11075 [Caulobacter segnis]